MFVQVLICKVNVLQVLEQIVMDNKPEFGIIEFYPF